MLKFAFSHLSDIRSSFHTCLAGTSDSFHLELVVRFPAFLVSPSQDL